MKECSKCKVKKPANYENFSRDTRLKDGFRTYCRECTRKMVNYYNIKNRKNNPNYYNEKTIYKLKGVYGVFENGKCLYVGESSKIKRRFSEHFTCLKNPELRMSKLHHNLYNNLRQHSHLIFGILEETENHKEREKYYINKLKPLYNG